ncbi:hypothetical protein GQ600_14780 [Phytophthora cactorum]|nr:hypothetical protein GQ600_14780 [Phytophthora cactorum]
MAFSVTASGQGPSATKITSGDLHVSPRTSFCGAYRRPGVETSRPAGRGSNPSLQRYRSFIPQNSTIQKLEEGMKKVLKDAAGRDIVILQLKEEVKAIHLPKKARNYKTQGDLICWRNSGFVFGLNPIVTSLDGIVRVESTGTYQVAVVVNHQAAGHNMSLQMMKGSDCIQSAYCGYAQGHLGSTTLTCTAHLAKTNSWLSSAPHPSWKLAT